MTHRAMQPFALVRASAVKLFLSAVFAIAFFPGVNINCAPVTLSEQTPISIVKLADGDYLLDFGRVAFGNLLLLPASSANVEVVLRLGESMREGRVDRTPPGTVRYSEVKVVLAGRPVVVAPPVNAQNTKIPAVLTPAEMGVLTPFRWVEVSGWPGELKLKDVRRRASFDSSWTDQAATFQSSDPMLDRIWDLCHYSIKAMTFAGTFIDGDRERLAYEADAYQNQLSYYASNPSSQIERDTFERLMQYPTWPTEWAPHMVFIAYADWIQTADKNWLAKHYEGLKSKLLLDRVKNDGLVHSTVEEIRRGDIVDWPAGERDGYVFTPVNTVVNAFYLRALGQMQELAQVLGRNEEARDYAQLRNRGVTAFLQLLFDEQTGLFRDGTDTSHSSLHANLFPLAFGLVPEGKRLHIAEWLAQRGMRGSVYAAQFLLEGLFENGQAAAALQEMTAPGDRSWRHMVESGTTITWEAWDQRYKPNQDWNHAWGAAPANLLPRFVLGVQTRKAGWDEAEIAPHSGGLQFASGRVPTPRGTIEISWKQTPRFTLLVQLPAGMKAKIRLPSANDSSGVRKDGKPVPARKEGGWWVLNEDVMGSAILEVR